MACQREIRVAAAGHGDVKDISGEVDRLGPSLTLPIARGEPALGTWPRVALVECDARPRERTAAITVMGEYGEMQQKCPES